jgi:KDO2-lipid IV(A) lauroyltransferase
MKRDLGYYLKWLDYHVLLRLYGKLPTRLAYACARLRAEYRYRNRQDARDAARRNMEALLPELSNAQRERYVHEFFYSPSLDELETYFLPRLTRQRLEKIMRIEGRERLDRALERGRGAILFSNHSGTAALFLVAVGLIGYKVNVIGRPLDEEVNPLHPVVRSYARPRVSWIEKHLGRRFIAPARGNSAFLAECLQANECVLTMLDVPPDIVRNKATVKFFGRDALLPSGFAQLAQQTGCALVPCEKYYLPDWAHQTLSFWEPLYASGDLTADVQACASIIERMIRSHPSQWWTWDNAGMLWAAPESSDGDPALA